MIGRRDDAKVTRGEILAPGEYGLDAQRGTWRACSPNGHGANLALHAVVEHDDGTITVMPSIGIGDRGDERGRPLSNLYHGFLERGIWRDVTGNAAPSNGSTHPAANEGTQLQEHPDVKIGQGVVFVDRLGVDRPAIVTAVWGTDPARLPSINVVIVSDDAAKGDTYGRQIERETSVPHANDQTAHGYKWRAV